VKYLKMLGLAAVAAMAAMSFIGATSASATVLCKVEPLLVNELLICHRDQVDRSKPSIIGTSTETSKLLNATKEALVECTESTTEGEITTASEEGNLASSLLGTITKLTFGGKCTSHVPLCESKAPEVKHNSETKAQVHLTYVKNHTSTIEILKPTTVLTLYCFGIPVKCTYADDDTVAGSYDDKTMLLSISAKVTSLSGGFCPAEGVEDVTYKMTTSNGLRWISEEGAAGEL
jgi:hypothetical protein